MTKNNSKYSHHTKGVILVNFGSPDDLSYFSIRRFLKNLLLDQRVVSLPRIIWLPILYGFILSFRPLGLIKSYKAIWLNEKSPLAYYQDSLLKKLSIKNVEFESAMIYSKPSLEEAWERLKAKGIRDVVIIPMYPQYCSATTGSVFDAWNLVMKKEKFIPGMKFLQSYHDHPLYITGLVNSIKTHWKHKGKGDHIIFSYHGIPKQQFDLGDPYYCYCHKTTRLVAECLNIPEKDYSMSFQSRFGKQVWLKPYLNEHIRDISALGCKKIDVLMPGFSMDCIETLYEVGVEYQEEASDLGCKLRIIPCLNDSEDAVKLYTALVQ
jgi:ferrochelatase